MGDFALSEARNALIAERAAQAPPIQSVPWRGGYVKAPVISLPADAPLYRVQNGRLIAELREQARNEGSSLDDFAAREATPEMQTRLHQLLVTQANSPRGPILKEMARVGEQTEPLLITAAGVVVNGNRRLAAMRELRRRDPKRYKAFDDIQVAVLPQDATTEDIEALEAALQMAPETKLAYGWINRRLKLRRQRDELGMSEEAICEASRLDGPPQLHRELAELDLVEDYLNNYCGEPGAYSRIGELRKLFLVLAETLGRLSPELRPLWRSAAFALIHGRAWVKQPLENQFPFAPPVPVHLPVWAMRRFAQEQTFEDVGEGEGDPAPAPSRKTEAEAVAEESEPLSRDMREDLSLRLSDPEQSRVNAPALSELMDRLRVDYHERHNPGRLLKLMEKLRRTMADLTPDNLDERERAQLRSHIVAVQAQVDGLLGDLDRAPPPGDLGSRLSRLVRRP